MSPLLEESSRSITCQPATLTKVAGPQGREVPFKDILQGTIQVPNEQVRTLVNAVQNAEETAQAG
jgi:hypothetical protein